MPPRAPDSVEAFLDLLHKSNILPPERLTAIPVRSELPADAASAAAELVRTGFLTKFQADQLLHGRYKGFRIGPYVIHEQLGRGGMGAVYLAEHLDLHRRVAIKLLAPAKGEDQKLTLERFLREARASAALDHPNIVRTFDVARAGQTPYLVMEYVDGETLQQLVDRDGPLPPAEAARYVARAAEGLRHAHEKGFVHRDIKPANLMRDRTGSIKLLDLGLARGGGDRDKLTEVLDAGAVVGTADYISPEQAMNGTVDRRADIYSLGATLYTLISGKVPFEGNTTQKLIHHQMTVPPALHTLNPDVPRELSAVVARMMSKKPTDRYQTAAAVVEALAPWALGAPPAPRRSRRPLALGVAVGLAGALVAVGLAAALAGGKPAPDTADPRPQPQPKGAPPAANPPKADPLPVRPEQIGPLVHRFDAAGIAAFTMRLKGGSVTEGTRGTFPAGVAAYSLKDGEAEFASGPIADTPAISIARAGGDTHLALELEREVANQGMGLILQSGTTYLLRIRHWSDASGQLTASVHGLNYRGGTAKTYPPTGSQWRTSELVFVRGAQPLRLTLAAVGPPNSKVAVGAVELFPVKAE